MTQSVQNEIKWNIYIYIDVQLLQADYVSCFSLRFFRAQAESCMLWNRIEHSQDFLFELP